MFTLSKKLEPIVQQTVEMMMWANESGSYASQEGLYGCYSDAIDVIASDESGLSLGEIKQINWNWYGNRTFVDDFNIAIREFMQQKEIDERKKSMTKREKLFSDYGYCACYYNEEDTFHVDVGDRIITVPNDPAKIMQFLGF